MSLPRGDFRFTPRNVLGAGLFFSLVGIVMTWPLVRDLPHAVSDAGDPLFCTWVLHWDWHQIFRDPLNLFQANIYHPARYTLAFSENLLGVAVFGFPLFLAGLAPITVYNVLFLLGMVLSACGAWALAAELTGDGIAALIAGLFYAWVPFRYDHRPHLQFQWGGFVPLALLFLIRFLQRRSTRDLALFSLFFVWNIYACIYYGVYGALAVAAVALLEGVRTRLWLDRRATRNLALALLISAGIVFPLLRPYSAASKLYGFHRSILDAEGGSATLTSFLSSGIGNRTYGRLTARFGSAELQLFYGLTVPFLAVTGLALLWMRHRQPGMEERRDARTPLVLRAIDVLILLVTVLRLNYAFTGGFHFGRLIAVHDPFRLSLWLAILLAIRLCARFPRASRYENFADYLRRSPWHGAAIVGIALTVLGWLLAAGPRFFPYRALYETAPFVVAGLRVPARTVVLTHIGIGILAAFGLSLWRNRVRRGLRIAIPCLVFGAVLFEFRTAPNDFYRADTKPLATSGWLSSHSFAGGVLELPWDVVDNIDYVYRTTEHGKPILNGYSGYSPSGANLVDARLQLYPIPSATYQILEKLDCRMIIFHSSRLSGADAGRVSEFLASGIREGFLTPVADLHEPRDEAYIFATAWRSDPISPAPDPVTLERSRTRALAFLDRSRSGDYDSRETRGHP